MTTVTVLSGPERRRRWSVEEKARIVEESYAPGTIVADVARRHDVHLNLLHHWRRRAREAGGRRMGFLPVSLAVSEVEEAVAERRPSRGGSIEIELAGVRVRVDAAVDEAALGRVLRALGR
jgi:transposase